MQYRDLRKTHRYIVASGSRGRLNVHGIHDSRNALTAVLEVQQRNPRAGVVPWSGAPESLKRVALRVTQRSLPWREGVG